MPLSFRKKKWEDLNSAYCQQSRVMKSSVVKEENVTGGWDKTDHQV